MHGVGNRLFFVGFHRNAELYRLRVRFRERIRFFRDVPVGPAKEMLNPRESPPVLSCDCAA